MEGLLRSIDEGGSHAALLSVAKVGINETYEMLKRKNPNISAPGRVSEFMDLCLSALHFYE